ncbi:MAG TPA: universal stress protein [Candidatus Angelobacter sp.]|nr:universal stress protein [Candidatus Angelobacter sp.]
MYREILIPTDGSELATKALRHGVILAKTVGARVTFLTVYEPYRILTINPAMIEYTPEEYTKYARQEAEKILAEGAHRAQEAGVPCETVQMEHEHIYQAIIDYATAHRCDLITMASHGRRGISTLVLGSVTLKVLTHCRIPVLVDR